MNPLAFRILILLAIGFSLWATHRIIAGGRKPPPESVNSLFWAVPILAVWLLIVGLAAIFGAP